METPPSPTAPPARRDPHRCACGARFEVVYQGDPLDDPVPVDVTCPGCGKTHPGIPIPRAARDHVAVECVPGPEPDIGGGD
jgi:hypothetical protein